MTDWAQPTQLSPGDVLTADIWNVVAADIPYFDWKTTATTVNTTTTETDLFNGEIIIPASAMGTDQRLIGYARFDIKNNTGAATDTPRFKLKLDTTVLFDSGTVGGTPIAASATRGSGWIEFMIQQLGATDAQDTLVNGRYVDGAKVNLTTGSGIHRTSGTNDGQLMYGGFQTAVDMTSARTLALTVINPSANANWETKLYAAKVAIGV